MSELAAPRVRFLFSGANLRSRYITALSLRRMKRSYLAGLPEGARTGHFCRFAPTCGGVELSSCSHVSLCLGSGIVNLRRLSLFHPFAHFFIERVLLRGLHSLRKGLEKLPGLSLRAPRHSIEAEFDAFTIVRRRGLSRYSTQWQYHTHPSEHYLHERARPLETVASLALAAPAINSWT